MDRTQFDLLVQLSSLTVEETEREGLMEDMNSILGYVEKLQELDLDAQEYTRSVVEATACREDVVISAPEAQIRGILENFPGKTDDGLLEAHAIFDR